MNITRSNFQHLDSLQSLRTICFLGILGYHCGILPTGPWAVTSFFILSGFVVYYSLSQKHNLDYTLHADLQYTFHRISQLYPLFFTMTVIVIVRQSIEKGTFSLNFVNFIANCLLLTSWIPPQYNIAPYLGVAWYLSTSVFLYFCSRRIYRFLQQKSLRTTYISMCCAYGLQVLFILWIFVCNFSEETRYWLSYEFPVFRLGDFFIGCCLGKIFLENNQKSYRISANSLEIFCVFFTAVCLLIYTLKIGFLGLDSVRHSILLLPSSVVTVYLFAQNKGKLTDLLTNQPSIWLARISPYGFLIHQEIIYQTKYLLFGPGKWQSSLHKVIVCAVSFFVTVLLSVFYVKLIRRKKSSK